MGELSDSFVAGLADQAQNLDIPTYIQHAASARGIDPATALKVAKSEGLGAYNGDMNGEGKYSSFGPFQLHYGSKAGGTNSVSGLGDQFTAKTGLDARDPSTVRQQIDFALDQAAQNGWGAWHGAQKIGLGNFDGIGGHPTQGASLGTNDASNPAAPIAQASGGGLADSFIQNLVAPQVQTPAPHPAPQIMNPTVGGQQQDQALRNYVSQVQPVPNNNSSWGPGQNYLSHTLPGGLGIRASALGEATNNALNGQGFNYGNALSSMQGQEALWKHENPGMDAITAGAGNVVGTTAALGAGGTAMRLGGNALAEAAPAAAPYIKAGVNFLGGLSGSTPGTVIPSSAGNLLTKTGSLAASGAIQGEASSAYDQGGMPLAPGRDALLGAATNTVLGPFGQFVTAPERAEVNPLIADAAKTLQDRNIPISPSNILQDTGLQKDAAKAVSANFKQKQLQAVTDDAASTIGLAPGTGVTPDTVNGAKRVIGAKLDAVAAATPVVPIDDTALTTLSGMKQRALTNLPSGDAQNSVLKAIDNIENEALTGVGNTGNPAISGSIYQDLTKSGNMISSLCENGSTYEYGKQLRWLLDQALENAAPQEMKGVTAQARQQWADAVTLGHVQAKSTSGIIDPLTLLNGTTNSWGISDQLRSLGAASNLKFPRPNTTGGVAGASLQAGMLSGLVHNAEPIGGGLTALAGAEAFNHVPEVANYLSGSPLAGPAALIGMGLGAGGMALRAARKSTLSSPATTNMLLQGGLPQVRPNAAIPLITQFGQNGKLPWQQ